MSFSHTKFIKELLGYEVGSLTRKAALDRWVRDERERARELMDEIEKKSAHEIAELKRIHNLDLTSDSYRLRCIQEESEYSYLVEHGVIPPNITTMSQLAKECNQAITELYFYVHYLYGIYDKDDVVKIRRAGTELKLIVPWYDKDCGWLWEHICEDLRRKEYCYSYLITRVLNLAQVPLNYVNHFTHFSGQWGEWFSGTEWENTFAIPDLPFVE